MEIIRAGGGGGSGDMLKGTYDSDNNSIVDQATKLQNARTIALTGSVSGSASFDGSGDVTITTTGAVTAGSGVTVVTSTSQLPTPDATYRGKDYHVTGVSLPIAQVNSLTINNPTTQDGEVIVTLGIYEKFIPVTTGETAIAIATKIRNTVFPGWTTGGSGATVTFTCQTKGARVANYNHNFSGATSTAGMTTTTQGVTGTQDERYALVHLPNDTYDWRNISAAGNFVSVKDFGAKGDGSDATQAFQDALDSIASNGNPGTGGVLFVPRGIYRISQQLVLRDVILKGESQQASVIYVSVALGTGVAAIVLTGNRGFLTGLEDIAIQCLIGSRVYGSKNHNCDGVYTKIYCFMNRVSITSFDSGLVIDGASHCRFTNCHIQQNYYNVYFKQDEGDHWFDMCIMDGASFACIAISGDTEGHPLNRFTSCHIGVAPFGIYQEAPTVLFNKEMMVEWYMDGLRFEAIGNAAIYSETWNTQNGKGITGCTFRNVGFSFVPDTFTDPTLPGYPKTHAVWAGYCSWTNIYEPGLYPFYHNTNPGGVGGIRIGNNNADWLGTFKMTDFSPLSGGYPRYISDQPEKNNIVGQTSGNFDAVFTSETGTIGEYPVRKIIIKFNNYVNNTAISDVFNFPVSMNSAPIILNNLAGFPTGAPLTITNTSISFKAQNTTPYSGFLILIGS